MDFTLVIPTRERPRGIVRLIDSIVGTAADLSRLQLIVRVDDDDVSSLAVLTGLVVPCKLEIYKAPRHANMSDLWEECLPRAIGDRIMMCADDVVFRTKGWDNIIRSRTPEPTKRVYFIWGNDGIQGAGLATLPMMSRAWISTLGFFVPRGYTHDWCDTHLQDIANRLAKLGIDTRVYCGEILFEHMHYTVGKAQIDSTYASRINMRFEAPQYEARANERQECAKKLFDAIQSGAVLGPSKP